MNQQVDRLWPLPDYHQFQVRHLLDLCDLCDVKTGCMPWLQASTLHCHR